MDLQLREVSAWYGQACALWGVSLTLAKGEVVGVLGRNGAGKTTLLRSIAGLQRRVEGQILFRGTSIERMRAHEISRLGLALLREGGKLPASLSVRQNLALGQRLARSRGKEGRELADVWRWFPMLEPLVERKAGLLSGGQRQALALAVAFVSEPEVILLDEPSAGLSPPVAQELFAIIGQLADAGATVLVVEQQPAWLEGLARRAYLLEIGKMVAEGPVEDLLRRPIE